jgi:5'-3' exonuclease
LRTDTATCQLLSYSHDSIGFNHRLSERYPKINQRHGCQPSKSICQTYFGVDPPDYLPAPDPLSECGLKPQVDRLYIDMNGVIHGCSHNNDTSGKPPLSNPEIFKNIAYYLDRVVKDIAKPTELVYMAIDGVAPRAKLNQQRARRYRAGKEGEIEQTIYDMYRPPQEEFFEFEAEDGRTAHHHRKMLKVDPFGNLDTETHYLEDHDDGAVEKIKSAEFRVDSDGPKTPHPSHESLKEVDAGRYSGKLELHEALDQIDEFHLTAITPGTDFFQECTAFLESFIQNKLKNDPAWQHLTIIFSGPNTPGEGEHKLMQFIREQKGHIDPNTRHCIMGQDGDLIMLGLVTHEPNLTLLREQVLFDWKARKHEAIQDMCGMETYIHNSNFEFLYMNVLRDYLAFEFETSNLIPTSPFDLERCIDDFVFMTFFVGNDFLPHMPAMDIADEAFDFLFYNYRHQRQQWIKDDPANPYLTDSGNLVSAKRLESFFQVIGGYESIYYDYKKSTQDMDELRDHHDRFGSGHLAPSEQVMNAKEDADRRRYREILSGVVEKQAQVPNDFAPVMSQQLQPTSASDGEHPTLLTALGTLLQYSVGDSEIGQGIDDKDFKGRYYADKFSFSPFDVDKHIALRKAYIEGLLWNLKYYYEGCVSWEWYYPFHYGPLMSDLVGLDSIVKEISFKMGKPLLPYDQLLACLPPTHATLLPAPYRRLMREEDSPIHDFYPKSFVVDMNGKRNSWEAVVLLPFIDTERLIEASKTIDMSELTDEERAKNQFQGAVVMSGRALDETQHEVSVVPFHESSLSIAYSKKKKPVFRPVIEKGTLVPLNGFPTLLDGTVTGLWRKEMKINIHGNPSRYTIACLSMQNPIPDAIPIKMVGEQLIGTIVYIDYPHLMEAFVTAVSDSSGIIRGKDSFRPWAVSEIEKRATRLTRVNKSYVTGEALVGSGGLAVEEGTTRMEDGDVLLYVRPLSGLKEMPNGVVGKTFAKFEMEVPLFVTSWVPYRPDPRLAATPALLEKDPYNQAKFLLADKEDEQAAALAAEHAMKRTFEKKFEEIFPEWDENDSRIENPMRPRTVVSDDSGLSDISIGEIFSSTPCLLSSYNARGTSKKTNTGARGYSTWTRPLSLDAGICRSTAPNTSFSSARFHTSPRGRLAAVGVMFLGILYNVADAAIYPTFDLSTRNSLPGIQFDAPASFSLDNMGLQEEGVSSGDKRTKLQFEHGTTTLSFTFPGGIILAVDSRASIGTFVGSKTVRKVLPINSHMLGTSK